ncbi:MAG: pimeloyl-ACP methyl ester esterase BioH [Methylococcales bacterium]|nr:pimeloyl-ACP methyl ester esterase BioH [Methylococcales bacterium]
MIKIHKEVYGQGKPIVLIHGWAMHTGIWRTFAKELAQNFQVTCLDLPGHGFSETVEPYTLENISFALMDVFPRSPVCLLGWSLGAVVALEMAINYPQQVSSVIMLAGNPRFIQDGAWAGMNPQLLEEFSTYLSKNSQLTLAHFLSLQVNGLSNGRRLLKDLKLGLAECDPPVDSVLLDGLKILKNVDLRTNLVAIDCPISIIQGDKDSLVPVQVSHDMQRIQPECEINILSEAGHAPFLSHQSEIVKIINQFV